MLIISSIFLAISHLYGIWVYILNKKHLKKIPRKTRSKKKKENSGSIIWFLILYTILIITYLSFAGYVPNDNKLAPQNWLGIIGVLISYYLLKFFGYASFFIFFFLMELIVHNRIPSHKKRFLFLIPLFLSILFFTGIYGIGGIIGSIFTKYSILYIGKIGGIFLFGLFALISLVVLLDESFYSPIFKFLKLLITSLIRIKNIFKYIRLPSFSNTSQKQRKKKKKEGKNEPENMESYNENILEDTKEAEFPLEQIYEETFDIPSNIPDIDDKFQEEILNQLKDPDETSTIDEKFIEKVKNNLEKTLKEFGIEGYVENVTSGPVVTRIEFRPASGVRLSKIVNLVDNIALSLETSPVRIEAPIPGKSLVGVEIPNEKRRTVLLKEIFSDDKIKNRKTHPLIVGLGRDIDNNLVTLNIAEMPHMIIAGTTGSGKSVAINTIISSIIYRNHPGKVRLIMVDPKRVELSAYNRIPHLMTPVVHDPESASKILQMATIWMEERYNKLRRNGVKDIFSYNKKIKNKEEIMPYIVIIIDELADLMMSSPKETESAIIRLAQMARAVGIHLILATQRPSADVITGLIRSNIPARMAFRVSTKIDSRIILDSNGAESLLGKGDMLVLTPNKTGITRAQGAFVSAEETRAISNLWAKRHLFLLLKNIDILPKEIKETFISEMVERDTIDAILWKEEFARASLENLLDEMGVSDEVADNIIEFMLNIKYYPPTIEEISDDMQTKDQEFQSSGKFPFTENDRRMIKKKYFVQFLKLAQQEGYISARMIHIIGGREADASVWIRRLKELGWISEERETRGKYRNKHKWLNHPDAIEFLNRIEGSNDYE